MTVRSTITSDVLTDLSQQLAEWIAYHRLTPDEVAAICADLGNETWHYVKDDDDENTEARDMTQITATLVKRMAGWNGDARLYKLSRPVDYGYDFDTEKPEGATDHVVVSAVIAPFSGPETFIFPANEDGEVFEYIEMEGSLRGALDHAEAIRRADWVLT